MRKQTKKILSWALAGALVLGLTGNINAVNADADEEKSVSAHISYADPNWAVQSWGAGSETAAVERMRQSPETVPIRCLWQTFLPIPRLASPCSVWIW